MARSIGRWDSADRPGDPGRVNRPQFRPPAPGRAVPGGGVRPGGAPGAPGAFGAPGASAPLFDPAHAARPRRPLPGPGTDQFGTVRRGVHQTGRVEPRRRADGVRPGPAGPPPAFAGRRVAPSRRPSLVDAVRGSALADSTRRAVGPGTPPWRKFALVTALLLPLGLVGVACGRQAAAPETVRVSRAGVQTTVTGTGALRAISEQNLGFLKGGKLVELNATVGQEVKAGTVLARVDDFFARSDVRKAQTVVDREQARLDALTDSEKADSADEDAEGAKDVLEATQTQSDQVDRANDRTVESAMLAVRGARARAQSAATAYEADSVRCRKSVGGDSRRKPGEVHQPGGLAGELFIPSPVESAACDRARRSSAALAEAEDGLSKAQAEERAARLKRNTDHAEQQVAIQNAKRAHTTAKNEAREVDSARPHEIEAQRAEVEDALNDLKVAQRGVEDTVLIAPVDGKVAAINGTLGEFIGDGGGTTAQSPGSRVSLPDVSSDLGEAASANSKSERPGLGSFMVLNDVKAFQVVVPFEESDAAKIKRNQPVELTFDSVPGLKTQGTVMSISPSGSSIQDVTNYYVTVVMNGGDDRLKDGQTAQANIVVDRLNDVMAVPNSAVQQGGASGLVTILEPDGTQRQIQVQLGARGDEFTEVLSGLREGQFVVVPGD